MSEGQHDDAPPGRALWKRAEQKRVAAKIGKRAWAKRIGIGSVTYDRLETQANPPQGKTIGLIAEAIGMSYDEAARLAGLLDREPPERRRRQLEQARDEERASYAVVDEVPLDELLAQIPERRRRQLEQIRDEERARYQRQVEQAREDYQRSMSRIGKIAQEEADN